MPRVLLLLKTSTYRAGAFLDAARRLRLDVTLGSDRAQALAERNPAGHLVLDFEDVHESVARVVAFAADHPLAAVVAADDDGIVLAAAAAGALALRHNHREAVERARDKLLMRRRLAAQGLHGPWFAAFRTDMDPAEAAERVRYPCVIKPVHLSGGRGVVRADDAAGFAAAFRRVAAIVEAADPGGGARILVEDFLPGAECSLEGVLCDGLLHTLAVFDKPGPIDGPFFEESVYVTPSRLPAAHVAAVSACVQEVAGALGLEEGPVHAQVRVDGGRAAIVEIAPRPIGGLCSRALRFDGGESLETLLLRHALGEDVTHREREARASGVMMIPIPRGGTLTGVSGLDAARAVPGIEDVLVTIPVGQPVVPLPEGSRYLGFLFARAGTPGEVETALRDAHARIDFDIRPATAVHPPDAGSGHEAHFEGTTA